jgi:hypothetical protein
VAVVVVEDKALVVELAEQAAAALAEMELLELLELLILEVAVVVAVKHFLHLPLKTAVRAALAL